MQDSYTAMMGGQQRTDPLPFKNDPGMSFKSYNRADINQTSASASSYYHGLNYGNPSFTASDSFASSLSLPTSVSHTYPPMPAHMQNPHTIHHTDMSRGLQSTSSATHGSSSHLPMNQQHVTSPQQTSPLGMASSPPMPSSSRVDSVSPEHDRSGHISSSSPGDNSMSKDLSDNSSEKSSEIKDEDLQGIPPKKRAFSDDQQKDEGYWDKRKKNNESAKRSREARRIKEEQIALRVVYLEQENLQLRTEVSLLKSEIEKLRCMLYNS